MLQETKETRKPSAARRAVYLLSEILAGSGMLESAFRRHNRLLEIVFGALFAFLLWAHLKGWGKREPKGFEHTPELLSKPTSSEDWRPPGAPPPIG